MPITFSHNIFNINLTTYWRGPNSLRFLTIWVKFLVKKNSIFQGLGTCCQWSNEQLKHLPESVNYWLDIEGHCKVIRRCEVVGGMCRRGRGCERAGWGENDQIISSCREFQRMKKIWFKKRISMLKCCEEFFFNFKNFF